MRSPVSSGADPNTTIGTAPQSLTYTPFGKTATISENGYQLTYNYGYDQERLTSELMQNGTIIETRNHWGVMEGVTKNGSSSELYYINAGNGLNNIIVKQNGAIQIYYTYTDQLGSIVAVTDEAGALVAEQNFDAWGRKRNPVDWTYNNISSVPGWLYRGFTGHEYLPPTFGGTGSGLINMNGRMYDPLTCQMLAPDRFVQDPGAPGGYNRYQYAHNNPLKYTDPSGWLNAQEMALAENIIRRTFETGELFGGFVTAGGGSGEYHTREEALDAGFAYMRKLISNGEQRLTAETWNGYMQEKWKNYAYNVNTTNSTSAKYGAGFQTTGLTFADANLGAAVTAWYSYSKAKALFLSAGQGKDQKSFSWSWGLDMALGATEANLGRIIKNRYVMSWPGYGPQPVRGPVTIKLPLGRTVDVSRKALGRIAGSLKWGGRALGAVGMVGTVVEIVNNEKKLIGEGGIDLIMGGVGFIPAGGWIVSGAYFGGKAILEWADWDFWND